MRHRRTVTKLLGGRAACALAALGACAVLVGCGSSSNSGSHSGSNSKSGASAGSGLKEVDVGVSAANINLLPLWVGEQMGYYQKAGLRIKTVTLTPTTTNTALTSGSVQFLDGSPNNFVTAVGQGVPQLAVSATSQGLPLGFVISKKFADAHHITSSTPTRVIAHDLVGSTGGAASPTTEGQAALFLEENGVSIKQVKVALLASPSVYLTALRDGQIDWFSTSEPLPLQAQAAGLGEVVATPSNVNAWTPANTGIGAIMITTKQYASGSSSMVKAFVTATAQATRYLRENEGSADVLGIASKNLSGVPQSILKQSIAAIDWRSNGQMTAAQWATTVGFISKLGALRPGTKVTSGDWSNAYLN